MRNILKDFGQWFPQVSGVIPIEFVLGPLSKIIRNHSHVFQEFYHD